MQDLLDLDRYPVDRGDVAVRLAERCRRDLASTGMFNLEGFVRPEAIRRAVEEIIPLASSAAFTHQRWHNVYFLKNVPGLREDHPALTRFQTINHTLCGDQLMGSIIERIYEWAPLVDFIARVLEIPRLYVMDDPLARVNILEYRPGEALNWHFDRARYTTTLLIQAAEEGGEFQYRSNLRSDEDPNYEAVGKLLQGEDSGIRVNPLAAGTLNIFAGKNTLHRVSPVRGARSRLVAVLSYYDRPGVTFSEKERLGFYGRSGPLSSGVEGQGMS
jgi:hypothetical protein